MDLQTVGLAMAVRKDLPAVHITRLPLELFEFIIQHLSREDLQSMRLVCTNFVPKVSPQLFGNVVVPFQADKSLPLASSPSSPVPDLASALLRDGTGVLEDFGHHIHKFALSCELHEDHLAFPPVKLTQQIIPVFWGMYRWPSEHYSRYEHMKRLENALDDGRHLGKALSCLTNVKSLGLCCDAGLGFLQGPDRQAKDPVRLTPIFSSPCDEHENSVSNFSVTATARDAVRERLNNAWDQRKRDMLEGMIRRAGFSESEANQAYDLLLGSESTALDNMDLGDSSPLHAEQSDPSSPASDSESQTKHLLHPNDLTRNQKEMLLEMEWVVRALIQTYVLAIIDNGFAGVFSHLENLTFAKIPSSRLHYLARGDLWQSLPTVSSVSLSVVPDWRRIDNSLGGDLNDTAISPTQAVSHAFELLNSHIGQQENIATISFEWIGGGEFALGDFQRNHYLLPAPFTHDPANMASFSVARTAPELLLQLPYARRLTLTNCWVAPHVLLSIVDTLSKASLQDLILQSVSLSGPPTAWPQGGILAAPAPVQAAHGHGTRLGDNLSLYTLGGGGAEESVWTWDNERLIESYQILSWSGFLECFSPSKKISKAIADDVNISDHFRRQAQLDTNLRYLPESWNPLKIYGHKVDKEQAGLRRIMLRSCGYVILDQPSINNNSLVSGTLCGSIRPHWPIETWSIAESMQTSSDKLLGVVNPCAPQWEQRILRQYFDLTIGEEEKRYHDVDVTGTRCPGKGRFTGVLSS